jgi:hypothetical protein
MNYLHCLKKFLFNEPLQNCYEPEKRRRIFVPKRRIFVPTMGNFLPKKEDFVSTRVGQFSKMIVNLHFK